MQRLIAAKYGQIRMSASKQVMSGTGEEVDVVPLVVVIMLVDRVVDEEERVGGA